MAGYKNTYKKVFATGLFLLLSLFIPISRTNAEQISLSVEGNGESSQNQIQTSTTNTTTVSQNNTAQVSNQVNNTANTGGNTASGNTGGQTSIQTGAAAVDTTVANQNINTNSATSSNCNCQQTINIDVTGNGQGSVNTVNASSTNTVNASQSNTALLSNNIHTSANTGQNTSDGNSGNVTITTGGIKHVENVSNKSINNSFMDISIPATSLDVKVDKNGQESVNTVNTFLNNSFLFSSNNFVDITNDLTHNFNTGGNHANSNNGNVLISTGMIESVVNISNENINSSIITATCGCEQPPQVPSQPPQPPQPPVSQPPTTSSSTTSGDGGEGNSSSSSGVGGESPAVLGAILPVTGGNWLFFATLLSLALFCAGIYLRLHSGCSPPTLAFTTA